MTFSGDNPFVERVDEARLERAHAYARRLLRDAPPPADPIARELRDEMAGGTRRPSELLAISEYDRTAETGLRQLTGWWQGLTEEQRADVRANADAEMDTVLGD